MSLEIDTKKIAAVMVGGQWFPVDGKSFVIDWYDFANGAAWQVQGSSNGETVMLGYTFVSGDAAYAGPITAIQSVRWRK